MRKFLNSWWKAAVGLLVGYAIGALVVVKWPVDYGMVLKYITAFVSFPMAIILIFTILIAVYKEEFRVLFSRMEGFKGPGFDLAFGMREKLEEQKETIVEAAVAASTEPEQKAIEQLEEGEARDERIEKLQQSESEIRGRILDHVSEALAVPEFEPHSSFRKHTEANAARVKELRTKIQIPMNRMLRALGIIPGSSKRHQEVMGTKWMRGRSMAIDNIILKMPQYAARYGVATLGAATDEAFAHYMSGGDTRPDHPPTMTTNSAAS